jgi:hypothetical protein
MKSLEAFQAHCDTLELKAGAARRSHSKLKLRRVQFRI